MSTKLTTIRLFPTDMLEHFIKVLDDRKIKNKRYYQAKTELIRRGEACCVDMTGD